MGRIMSPVIEEINYSNKSLISLQGDLSVEKKGLIFEYPILYIVNDKKSDGYSVYVGETTDIIRRTNQHLV